MRRSRGRPRREPPPDINERLLRFDEVRLVDNEGEQLGVMPTREALNKAKDQGMDLVLVAQKAQPPVAKIIDYGRWKYEQNKIRRENKRKTQEVKGITMRPGTAEHDLQVIVRKATKFLGSGDKVRIVCRFRYRELAHPDVGKQKLLNIAERLSEFGKAEREPALNGREMVMVLNPISGKQEKKSDGKGKEDEAEDE